MPKGVLFDLDGTLLDSSPDFIYSLNALLTKYDRKHLDPQIIRRHVSDGTWKLISLGFEIEQNTAECLRLRDELLEVYEQNSLKFGGLFAGIDKMLIQLAENNIPYGIVTNKPLRFAEPIVKKIDAFAGCRTLICPDHLQASKPDPQGILMGCEHLGIKPSDCIYVGDHLKDIQAGLNAGTDVIACYFGYALRPSDHSPSISGAHQPDELFQLIQSL